MAEIVASIAAEFRRYRALAEGAVAQLADDELGEPVAGHTNSVATVLWHVGGNLASRFTDFLTTDGEKPWRDREDEFAERRVDRTEVLGHWNRGWRILVGTLERLSDSDLGRTVTIRGIELSVAEALHRSLAHTAYHVGQIVHMARAFRGQDWRFLSIPPGGTAAYNADPTKEKGPSD